MDPNITARYQIPWQLYDPWKYLVSIAKFENGAKNGLND